VLADEKSGTLYVCSNDLGAMGVAGPGDEKGASLKTFDLKTGAAKGSFPLKDAKSLCNDIAVGSDGTAYVTDSFAPYVYSLKPGATALEVWATDPLLAPAKDGVGLDGIAVGADGDLYVTTYIPAKLFRIAAKDGKAGSITELKPSRALDHADAMRAHGDGFLLVEGAGRLDRVTIKMLWGGADGEGLWHSRRSVQRHQRSATCRNLLRRAGPSPPSSRIARSSP
jgi:sugar lactone lactonase YvrE